ncbi:tripartite tricarboxylate transporter substrate binding protein BugE [Acidovorax sp. GBBC 3334]|uniref:tripartite tricarboxylate transporter substrate binding protein BugE n=1 Tax=unclassified Acidovorax TaxID=2684926 RepID=UPI00230442F9|nr:MULTISPECIES: tripartite tricarboxylate transporter substrate binding protein BugE [unclassified Acidovorax]MDA8455843.1 tripartite tricarboxylate transporter substrate binding protein BugE [Acidovorax sp. GBBC 3334]MDA8523096.1 tripartite tricarboxylate transporter substrate binding protein BugE [Acidovorax sp. NCPPB 4044]
MTTTPATQLCSAVLAAAGLLAGAAPALAQDYPTKPVRLIVPFAPGGTTDIVARVVSQSLSTTLGQSVVVDNKAGAGGVVGATEIARAAPDGYTLGVATVSSVASAPAINPAVKYDPLTDFTSIVNMAATPNVLAVHPSFAAKDFKSFMAEVKAKPGKYAFATSGTGGIGHLQMELFKSLSGLELEHIGYKGAGPALNDAVSGQVPMIFDNLPSALPFIKEKRLIAIAVAAPQRLPSMPDVPTFKEVGFEPVNRMAFYGIHGPKNLPRNVVDKISQAVKKTLEDPAVRQRIEDTGSLVVGNTPAEFTAQTKAEYELYKGVVAKQKLKLD